MGWLYMQTLKGHQGPRDHLDAQFTAQTADTGSRVLRSALVGMRVYYAAIERLSSVTGERTVWAAICLVRYNRRARDGYIFGYKYMDETVGPFEYDCPEPILDLLTPTTSEYAMQWRARCRANIMERRVRKAKPPPRPGQTIIFDDPITFRDGHTFAQFDVVANPRSHRTVLFRASGSPALYRIPNVKNLAYRLEDPSHGSDRH